VGLDYRMARVAAHWSRAIADQVSLRGPVVTKMMKMRTTMNSSRRIFTKKSLPPRRRAYARARRRSPRRIWWIVACIGTLLAGVGIWRLTVHFRDGGETDRKASEELRTASSTALVLETINPADGDDYVPPFTGETKEGKPFAISEFEDTVPMVILFWATWCDACMAELASLASITETYGATRPLFIAIHRGDTEGMPDTINALGNIDSRIVVLKDPRGTLFDLLGQGKPHMPFTLFADSLGKILVRGRGPQTLEQLRVNVARIEAPAGTNPNNQ